MSQFRSGLKFEALEDRRLLAVTVFQAGNTIVVDGDAAADSVEIFQDGNRLVVRGNDGTVVTGSAGFMGTGTTGPNNTRSFAIPSTGAGGDRFNLAVDLDGGADKAHIHDIDEDGGRRLGNLVVRTGGAFDQVKIERLSADSIFVDSGAAVDFVRILNTESSRRIGIDTGTGATADADIVTLGDIKVGTGDRGISEASFNARTTTFVNNLVTVDGGPAVISTTNPFVGSDLGSGNNFRGLGVETAAGDDRITADRVQVSARVNANSQTQLLTAAGADSVIVRQSFFAETVNVQLGGGVDNLEIVDSVFLGNFNFVGGAGRDSIALVENKFAPFGGLDDDADEDEVDDALEARAIAGSFEQRTIRDNEILEDDDIDEAEDEFEEELEDD